MNSTINTFSRPQEIKISFFIMIVATLVGFLDLIIQKIGLSVQNFSFSSLRDFIFSIVLNLVLFYFIFKRHNWARVILAILTLLGLAVVPIVLIEELNNDIIGAVSTLLQAILLLGMVWLLFTKKVNAWFKTRDI
ncbi:hypothetical protein ACFL4C_02300 [Candidatus Omnitrophota bacterium]